MRQAQWPRAPNGRLEVRHPPGVCCPQAGEGLPRTAQTLGAWSHTPQPGGTGRPFRLLCPPKRACPCFPSWAQKHESWRFQKTRQTWLLLHMYDHDKVCARGGVGALPGYKVCALCGGWGAGLPVTGRGRAHWQDLLGPHWPEVPRPSSLGLPCSGGQEGQPQQPALARELLHEASSHRAYPGTGKKEALAPLGRLWEHPVQPLISQR